MYGRHKYATPTYSKPRVMKRRAAVKGSTFDPAKVSRTLSPRSVHHA